MVNLSPNKKTGNPDVDTHPLPAIILISIVIANLPWSASTYVYAVQVRLQQAAARHRMALAAVASQATPAVPLPPRLLPQGCKLAVRVGDRDATTSPSLATKRMRPNAPDAPALLLIAHRHRRTATGVRGGHDTTNPRVRIRQAHTNALFV